MTNKIRIKTKVEHTLLHFSIRARRSGAYALEAKRISAEQPNNFYAEMAYRVWSKAAHDWSLAAMELRQTLR